eukprot:737298_1
MKCKDSRTDETTWETSPSKKRKKLVLPKLPDSVIGEGERQKQQPRPFDTSSRSVMNSSNFYANVIREEFERNVPDRPKRARPESLNKLKPFRPIKKSKHTGGIPNGWESDDSGETVTVTRTNLRSDANYPATLGQIPRPISGVKRRREAGSENMFDGNHGTRERANSASSTGSLSSAQCSFLSPSGVPSHWGSDSGDTLDSDFCLDDFTREQRNETSQHSGKIEPITSGRQFQAIVNGGPSVLSTRLLQLLRRRVKTNACPGTLHGLQGLLDKAGGCDESIYQDLGFTAPHASSVRDQDKWLADTSFSTYRADARIRDIASVLPKLRFTESYVDIGAGGACITAG